MKSFITFILILLIAGSSYGQSNPQHKRTQKLFMVIPKNMTKNQAKKITLTSDSLKRSGYIVLDAVENPNAYCLIFVKYSK